MYKMFDMFWTNIRQRNHIKSKLKRLSKILISRQQFEVRSLHLRNEEYDQVKETDINRICVKYRDG